jgi:hypothetical protein
MRQQTGGRRPRNRPNRKQNVSPRINNFDSQGPEGRVRGNAPQVYEKYMSLGRDATSVGDRIGAESFYQFAEHYYRIMNDSTDPERRNNDYPRQVREQPRDGDETDRGWNNDRGAEPALQQGRTAIAGSPAEPQPAEPQPAEPQAAEQPQANRSLREQPRAERPRLEQRRAEQPQAEQPQAEQPQAETSPAERPRVGRPRIARSRTEHPRPEQPRIEQPQAAPSPVEQPRAEPSVDPAPGADGAAPTEGSTGEAKVAVEPKAKPRARRRTTKAAIDPKVVEKATPED